MTQVKNIVPPDENKPMAADACTLQVFADFSDISLAERRVFFLLVLLACQAIALRFTIHPRANTYDRSYSLLGETLEPTAYFIVGFLLLLSTHFSIFWRALINDAINYNWRRFIIPQILCYFIIIYSASKLMPTDFFAFKKLSTGSEGFWEFLLVVSVFMTSSLSLRIIAPKAYWIRFIKTERTTLLLALAFSIAILVFGSLVQSSWNVLSEPTMKTSKFFLDQIYDVVYADLRTRMLGTPNFMVMIDYRCSGYEGIGMITVFLTWYLMSFRNDFKFPAALLLFPIGITIIWLFNSIRISLLIFIGSSISPAIAMQGFHSNAGWVSFIMVSLGIIFFARNVKMFRGTVSTPPFTIDSVNALVIPFLVTLAVTLISSSFSTEFQWLYPVRVIFTGLAIFLLWKHFNIEVLAPPLFAILAGIFVFLLWIAMVSPSIEGDRKFGENLFNAPDYWSTGWIIMRLLGSVIIIPIAEELAFRGYLFSFFPSDRVNKGTTKEIQWVPMVLTSVLFGALHSFWVAGTIAGCVYYLVKLRSGHIWNAIVAHMTTNLLLSSYVLISGHWSYW